jgi:hypothetical protein
MLNLTNNEKATLFNIMLKYDTILPVLGDALSNVIQGSSSLNDITIIDKLICSNRLDKKDKNDLDSIFITESIELNF